MENIFIGLDIGKKLVDVAVPVGNGGFSCFRVNNTAIDFQKREIKDVVSVSQNRNATIIAAFEAEGSPAEKS